MAGRFPKTWYEWVLVTLSAILFIGQGLSSITSMVEAPFISTSPLLPKYAIYFVALKNLPVVISMLAGLLGIILSLCKKQSGWGFMLTGALFFIYLRLLFLLPPSLERLHIVLFTHLLIMTGLLVLLLLRRKPVFNTGLKHCLLTVSAIASLIFMHLDACGISLFMATQL